MGGVVRESERGYDAEDYRALPSRTDIPGAVVAGPGERVLDAMDFDTAYIDTAYFDTAGMDVTCAHGRVRHYSAGWTLRLPVAEDGRDEVGAPGRNRRRPRAELARLVRTLMLAVGLRRVAMMTCRRWWRVLDADGVLPADVAVDRVGARWVSGDTPFARREIEVGLGERGNRGRRARPGWAAVPVAGRLVVWGLGKLVARRVARAAAS